MSCCMLHTQHVLMKVIHIILYYFLWQIRTTDWQECTANSAHSGLDNINLTFQLFNWSKPNFLPQARCAGSLFWPLFPLGPGFHTSTVCFCRLLHSWGIRSHSWTKRKWSQLQRGLMKFALGLGTAYITKRDTCCLRFLTAFFVLITVLANNK